MKTSLRKSMGKSMKKSMRMVADVIKIEDRNIEIKTLFVIDSLEDTE
jgi:hypothetical protein